MSLLDDVCGHAATLHGAWRDPAWGMEGDVFKTAAGRIFAICSGDPHAARITLKLPAEDAAAALMLPFVKTAVWPSRWITATVRVEAERDIVLAWIDQSYQLVTGARNRK